LAQANSDQVIGRAFKARTMWRQLKLMPQV
jgi:hypothetical protein